MEKSIDSRIKKNRFNYFSIAIAFILALAGLATFAISLSFVSNPQLNSGQTIYTADNILCSWQASADTTSTNVTWYKDGVSQFTVIVVGNSTTLNSENTTKNEEWTCEVKLYNATDVLLFNVSENISNSLPYNPKIYNSSGSDLGDTISIYEDSVYNYIFNATDDDGDTLSYSSDAGSFCSLNIDENSGAITCSPTNDDLLDAHTVRTKQISFIPNDGGQGVGEFLKVNFSVYPVNDQAQFEQSISDLTAQAENPWKLFVNGTDEESDYDLIFTLSSDFLTAYPGMLIIESYNSTTANLTFNTTDNAPTNFYIGNWSVSINITDNASSNSTRPPSQNNFTLEITSINHAPQITTNFNVTNGTQGQVLQATIYANDSDNGNTLTFDLLNSSASNETCNVDFPWSITTTNSSRLNASGVINLNMTNDNVICKYVNVSVSDQYGATDTRLVFFNITNVNDVPQFYEISEDGNISNQSLPLFTSFSYHVNATDIDNLTYDYVNTGTLFYYINDSSILSINSSTGLIYGTPENVSFVGNWSINVTVSDGQYNVSRILNFIISGNSAPILNLSNNNFTTYQNNTMLINFTALELDNETMNVTFSSFTNFNNSIYSLETISNDYSGNQNLETLVLNLSRTNNLSANALVGVHTLQINVTDEVGAFESSNSSGIINFTINNTNDAPFFDMNKNNVPDLVNFETIIVNRPFTKIINVTDFDLFLSSEFANENLSFSYSDVDANITNLTFTKIGSTQATISFIPSDSGNRSLVLIVSDSEGLNTSQNVSFQIYLNSTPPVFKEIKPYKNMSSEETILDFGNASLFPSKSLTINISENTTVLFDADVENDTTISDNNLTFKWFVNSILNQTIEGALPTYNSNFSYDFDFFSNGTRNIILEAVDSRFSATNWTWYVNIADVNRPPQLIGTLENLSVNLSTNYLNYFSYRNGVQRFYDADDDLNSNGIRSSDFGENGSLTYSILGSGACSFISFSVSNDDLSITPSQTGFCEVKFKATDRYNQSVTSPFIRIEVVGFEPTAGTDVSSSSSGGSSTRTQVVTVPFEEEVDVPKPIELVAPGRVETYVNKTLVIPITIRNKWTEVVRGISLSSIALNATFFDEPNATLKFENNYFPSIPVNGEYKTKLIVSNYRTQGPFEISVIANVREPEFTDSATILINSLEQSTAGDEITAKVTFAKDMISENPECKELNSLLERADEAIENLDYREALNLVNGVINGCKYLISQDQKVRNESPSLIEASLDFISQYSNEIIIGAGALTTLTIIFYAIAGIVRFVEERNNK